MIIRSRAPLRISFGGGGTDVSPYIEQKGGAVINTTIDKYAFATLTSRDDTLVKAKSLDYNSEVIFDLERPGEYNGRLDLVKAAVKLLGVKQGFEMLLHTDAAPGTGLGSSSTLTTAIIGAFREWLKLPMTDYEVAELAYRVERLDVGIKGGKQDQYATVFGGVNFIEFYADKTIVNQLRIKPDILNELEYRLVLCNTGQSRQSGEILRDQVENYTRGEEEIVRALDHTKALAYEIKDAIMLGQIDRIGELLHEGWEHKKRFSARITNPFIDKLYETARKNGAIGGKLLGAGGGGHLLLLCHNGKKHAVLESLRQAGGIITPFAFEFRGLQNWRVNG